MKRIIQKLGYLADLTPRETWRLARGRLPFLRQGQRWAAKDLLNSAKHRHGIRFAEFLLRQEAILIREIGWKPLHFDGADVVEIGCGPLGGYGPLAIFRGAKSFISADPEWDAGLFRQEEIANRYFRIMHADLVALYGPLMDFASFKQGLADRVTVHKTGFSEASIGGNADIVLSQSCLEHVFPLEKTIEKLAEIQRPQTRFLHLVDFGNHYLAPNPFEGLYEEPPENYIVKRGKAINMLRLSDVEKYFAENSISFSVVPTRVVPDAFKGQLHPWWRERYDDRSLFTQLALFAGPAV